LRADQERNERGKEEHNSPGAESLWGRRMTAGDAEKSQHFHKYFNTVQLLPKDLRFEHGGAKLVSCPGRHLTSLRPWRRLVVYGDVG